MWLLRKRKHTILLIHRTSAHTLKSSVLYWVIKLFPRQCATLCQGVGVSQGSVIDAFSPPKGCNCSHRWHKADTHFTWLVGITLVWIWMSSMSWRKMADCLVFCRLQRHDAFPRSAQCTVVSGLMHKQRYDLFMLLIIRICRKSNTLYCKDVFL